MSSLHNVYYRVFRLGPDPSARPLVEGAVWARIDGDPPIHGSVAVDDVLIETTSAGGLGGMPYEVIRHYRFEHDTVRRIDPLALCPRDFVYEWLSSEWTTAAASWSESASRRTMLDWHERLGKRSGEFTYPTLHCPATPDLWQVGADFGDPLTFPLKATNYFLVRWRPPYNFSMVEVSDQPWPQCTEEDRKADEARTLFLQ
jgi:hypothetical protein